MSIAEIRTELKHKLEWQAYHMAGLDLWMHAHEAGYPSDTIETFTFRPEFLDKQQTRRYTRKRAYRTGWFNCVRLYTGELKPIPLIEKPEKPDGDDPSETYK